jgi:hypothetical protein
MADHHQIVDQIRAFVQASDQTRSATLEALAAAYIDACVEINQRVGRCHRLLQQGLRSEAIQLADSDPRLLDAIAALDFPERADWDELLQIYELPVAPKLAVEQAEALNEAYAEQDPLEDLLRRHRRLALQRAPLRSRISVMRKLAAQDTLNPIWNDDLRTFEKARFREMQAEAATAAQSRNVPALCQLLAEIDQQTWVEAPPKTLVQALRKADTQLRGEQTRAALAEVNARLNAAYAASDPIRGRLARQDWIALTSAAPLDPHDPIWERVRDALTWLDDQDRHDALDHAHDEAVAALKTALDDPKHVAPAELERLAHVVLQYGRGMAEGLQQRYVARLRSAESARTLRVRLVTASAAAATILIGSILFYVVRSSNRASAATEAGAAISNMIEQGELEQAEGFLARLEKADATLLKYPPMIEARGKLDALKNKENERILEFDKALRALAQIPLARLNPPEIEAARKAARLQTEKDAVEELLRRRTADLAQERAKHETQLNPRLDAIGRQVAELERKFDANAPGTVDEAALHEAVSQAQRGLGELGPELPLVGGRAQAVAAALSEKLAAIRSRLDRRRQRGRVDDEITAVTAYSPTKSLIDIAGFVTALDHYIKEFPDDLRSAAFKKTKEEQTLWKGVQAWNAAAGLWKPGDTAQMTAQEAKLRGDLCGKFLAQNSGFPSAAEILMYQKYLEAIARRAASDESPAAKIRSLFTDILVDHVWMVTTKDDADANSKSTVKRYYATKQPIDDGNFVRFNCVISFEGTEKARTILKDRVAYLGLSPQSKIAERFGPDLVDESKLAQWENLMMDLVEAILRAPDIDPILQVVLLRKVVDSAIEGSEPLRASFESLKARLDVANVDANVPWMNPEIPRVGRERALQVVQNVGGALEPRKQVLARANEIETNALRTYRTAGWLAHEGDSWQLRSGAVLPPAGELYVIVMLETKQGEWRKVGAVSENKATIDSPDPAALAEGRPVFVIAGGS